MIASKTKNAAPKNQANGYFIIDTPMGLMFQPLHRVR
jgi:hypothetical protein